MNTWAPTETQIAIYNILKGDAELVALLKGDSTHPRIFDSEAVPEKQEYPFLTLKIKPISERGTHTDDGVTIDYQITVWWQPHKPANSQVLGRGDKGVQEIQAAVDRLLDRKSICINGWGVISHNKTLINILDAGDGMTKHGIQMFKIRLGGANGV